MVKSEEISAQNKGDAVEEDKKLPAKRKRSLSAKAAVNYNEDSGSDYEEDPPAKRQRKGAAKKSGRGKQNKLTDGTKSSKALPLDAMVRTYPLRLVLLRPTQNAHKRRRDRES